MRFYVKLPVTKVTGYQVFAVDAANEEAALTAVANGSGDFVEEEVNVEETGQGRIVKGY